jgi:hypothetical protein
MRVSTIGKPAASASSNWHILCFQYKEDAERVLEALRKRFAKYGLCGKSARWGL